MEIKLSIKINGLKKIKKAFKLDDIIKALEILCAGSDPKTMTAEDFLKMFKG